MTSPTASTPPRAETDATLLSLAQTIADTARSVGYETVDARARAAAAHYTARTKRVVIVGESNKGKSALANALVRAPVAPVGPDATSAIPLDIAGGDELRVELVHGPSPPRGDGPRHDPAGHAVFDGGLLDSGLLDGGLLDGGLLDGGADGSEHEIDVVSVVEWADRHDYFALPQRGAGADRIASARIDLPGTRRVLARGMRLVDTATDGWTTATALAADAVLFVTDASQELVASEMDALRTVASHCPDVAVVMTKIDLYRHWGRIAEINRGHLHRHGLELPLVPVSNPLRDRAASTADKELNEESGFDALVRLLCVEYEGRWDREALDLLRSQVETLLADLSRQLRDERAVLADPERVAELKRQREAAALHEKRMRSEAMGWLKDLTGELNALGSEVAFEFQLRFRGLQTEAGERIDKIDPARAWTEFDEWMASRVRSELDETLGLLRQRAQEIVDRAASRFADAKTDLTSIIEVDETAAAARETQLQQPRTENVRTVSQAFTVVRSAYSRAFLFGFVGTNLLGMEPWFTALAAVVSIPTAAAAYRKQTVTQRRTAAKQVASSHLQEVHLRANKAAQDAVKQCTKRLTAHFQAVADSAIETAAEYQRQTQRDTAQSDDDRRQRLTVVTEALKRAEAAHKTVQALQQDQP